MTSLWTACYAVALIGVVIWAARRGPTALVLAYTFFIPWFGVQANIGLTLNVDRLVAALLILWVVATQGTKSLAGYGAFLVFIIGDTIVQSMALPPTAADFSALQGEYRWVFQIVMWTLLVLPGSIVAAWKSRDIVTATYSALTISAAVLAALAIIQFAVYTVTGFDLFPIGFMDPAGTIRSAAFEAGDMLLGQTRVFRAGALAGEPKHLASTLALVLGILAAQASFGSVLKLSARTVRYAAVLCSVALVLTFSTQGLVLAVLNVSFVLMASPAVGGSSWKRYRKLLGAVVVGAALLALVPGLVGVLRQRTLGRIEDVGVVEDWNQAVLEWLKQDPGALALGVGLGNVHLYAARFIPVEFQYYMNDKVFVAKSGALRIASETGVFGLILFGIAVVAPLTRLSRLARGGDRMAGAQALIGALAVINYTLSADGPTYVFLIGGLSLAVLRNGVSGCALESERSESWGQR